MVSQRKAGAVLSYVSLGINALVSFLYVPILLSALTTSEFGVYELIGSIIAYLSVMDLGLSTTLSRFYVHESVSGSKERVESLLATAAVVYGVLSIVSVVIGLIINASLDSIFGETFTASELKLAHQMMALVILNCIVVLPGNWFLALINARERFVFSRCVSIIKYLFQISVVVIVLQCHAGALGVLIVQVALNIVAIGCYALYCAKKLCIRFKLHSWDWRLVRDLFSFSFFILLNMAFDQVFWKTGQVVLGAVSGAAAVAVYGIVCKLITAGYMQVSTGVTGVFLPKLTSIAARTSDMAEINLIFNRIGRIQAMLVWGVFAGFVVLGAPFILLWAGESFAEAYPCVVVLMAGLSISLIQNLGISILQAKNKMGFRSALYVVLAILDVVVSIPVAQKFGAIGCAVVAACLLFVGTGPIMNYYYAKYIKIDIKAFFQAVFPLFFPPCITASICSVVLCFFPITSWFGLAVGALVFATIYVAVLRFGFLNEYEKSLLDGIVDRLRRR